MEMATTPESTPDITIDFRAPPPSPIASGRRSSVANDDVLTGFLETSLRVPDLILPDNIFPRHKYHETPPKVDFRSFCCDGDQAALCDVVLDSMVRIGCFQLVNHGIPRELMMSVAEAAKGIFEVPPEKRAAVTRSPDKSWGFEEHHADEEGSELDEEFLWCRDQELELKMEDVWFGYSKFSKKMGTFVSSIEKVAEKILEVMSRNCSRKFTNESDSDDGDEVGTVCCVYKHSQDNRTERWSNYLKYDVIRMLIRGIDYSHALCLHACDGSTAFHVYSKKGWLSFCPEEGALIITAGDQTQAVSGGKYKHVTGRPIFNGDQKEESISMAFLYSPSNKHSSFEANRERTISLVHQAMVAIILTLVYQVLAYVYQKL